MSRTDLLALTPQALAALSNVGLVKRAQRELEQGRAPSLEVRADGTVIGRFEDGAIAALEPGKGLERSPCSCGAARVCRHRIAVVLAYAKLDAPQEPPGVGGSQVHATQPDRVPWSPGTIGDEELARMLPRRVLERARAVRTAGFIARVCRGSPFVEDVPSVELSTCTVRFLVPHDVTYARCDCSVSTQCEHVALAVWAFRGADAASVSAATLTVEVADARIDAETTSSGPTAAREVAQLVLLEGVQNLGSGTGVRFAVTRAPLERAKMVWLLAAVDELEEQLSAYASRSARYRATRTAEVVAEIFARIRAASGSGEQPPRAILGIDESPETKLDHLRLLSLGARAYADGRERRVDLFLVDPSTAGLLVFRRAFTFAPDQPPENGPRLGRRSGVSGSTLELLARGQLVTSGATRFPNRQLVITSRGLQRTSVTPQSGDWSAVPAPMRVEDVRALEAELAQRPPAFLRPRLIAEDVRAFAVGRVLDVAYSPGEQRLSARVEDSVGGAFTVALAYRAVAPGALEALADALRGTAGPLRYLSGEVRRTPDGLVVEPLAVVCGSQGPVVLDLAPDATTERVRTEQDDSALRPIPAMLSEIRDVLAEGVHAGLRHVPTAWITRLRDAANRTSEHGLTRLSTELVSLATALNAARVTGSIDTNAEVAEAWTDASIRVAIAIEQLGAYEE